MKAVEQTIGQTILAHGLDVSKHYLDLHHWIVNDAELKLDWDLPSWLQENKKQFAQRLISLQVAQTYQVFHDCGKPYCLSIDSEGKKHFKNHAALSKETWLNVGGSCDVGDLIGMDMDIHTIKAENVKEFANRTQSATLLLTGLAEVHSNAKMFGGRQSDSFKIKRKRLEQRGKTIIKNWLDQEKE